MTGIDPERIGFLTQRQRNYLTENLDDLDSGDENSLRAKIRKRIETAFSEMKLLESERIDANERELIVESGKESAGNTLIDWPDKEEFLRKGPVGLTFGFISLFKFYHKALRENGYSRQSQCETVAYALKKAEQEYLKGHQQVEVTVNIESVEEVDVKSAKIRYEEGGTSSVSNVELRALVEAGYFNSDG